MQDIKCTIIFIDNKKILVFFLKKIVLLP